jgi:hypothetical protein
MPDRTTSCKDQAEDRKSGVSSPRDINNVAEILNSPQAILLAPYFRKGLRTAGIVMLIVGSLVAVMARSLTVLA